MNEWIDVYEVVPTIPSCIIFYDAGSIRCVRNLV